MCYCPPKKNNSVSHFSHKMVWLASKPSSGSNFVKWRRKSVTFGPSQSQGRILNEFEGSYYIECCWRTVKKWWSRILQILQWTESFFLRMPVWILGASKVPTILCARCLAVLLKLANLFNDAHLLACYVMFSQNARTRLPRTCPTKEVSST